MASNSLFFFRAPVAYDEKAVRKHVTADLLPLLSELLLELGALANWSGPEIHECIAGFAAAKGVSLGKLAQPLRLAVCGGTVSPPIDATLSILGKAESQGRLAKALATWSA
jgi:glutamyl-tRNA synthetase